jgi:hypothetical protein
MFKPSMPSMIDSQLEVPGTCGTESWSMIQTSMPSGHDPMGGYRFSENDHAQTITSMTIHPEVIALQDWACDAAPH